jgi:hypothetical protein
MLESIRSAMTRVLGTLITAILISAPGLAAQAGPVYGQVTDAQTGLPVPGVQVFIFTLEIGGLSQQNGRFLLQSVPAGTHTLTANRVGYRAIQHEITVAGDPVEQNRGEAQYLGLAAIFNFAISYETPAQPYPDPFVRPN